MPSPPDSADQAAPRPRRYLIAAGTSRYKNMPPDRQLPSVNEDLRRIASIFYSWAILLGYERVLASVSLRETQDSTALF